MPTAIPPATRREIVRMCQSGKTAAEVSRELNLGYPGVAKIWRLFRRFGTSALETGYSRCGRKPVYAQAIRNKIDQALEDNEQLGAPIIRARLLALGQVTQYVFPFMPLATLDHSCQAKDFLEGFFDPFGPVYNAQQAFLVAEISLDYLPQQLSNGLAVF